MNTAIKKSAWKGVPPINSPNAETVEEIRGLVNFARTVGRGMAIFISRTACMEAKLDCKRTCKHYFSKVWESSLQVPYDVIILIDDSDTDKTREYVERFRNTAKRLS